MNTSNLDIPMTSKSFYKESEKSAILNKVALFGTKYAREITQAATLCNVPEVLIKAFIFVEGAGENLKPRSTRGATGLMQVEPDTATNVILRENKNKRLSELEKAILIKTLGNRFSCLLQMKWDNHKLPCNKNTGAVVTQVDLLNPEFNILVGTMYLGQLLDQHNEGGILRLDKVVVRYNRGMNSKPSGATADAVISFAKKNYGQTAADYVPKVVGRNGMLDILA